MQTLFDKESKATFNFPGLTDKGQAMPVQPVQAMQAMQAAPVLKRTKKAAAIEVPGTKKLSLTKPKY